MDDGLAARKKSGLCLAFSLRAAALPPAALTAL
jgi:hypothetical protein